MKAKLIVLVVSTISCLAYADPVVFNNINLKTAVEAALGIADPNSSDMLKLTTLSAVSKNITDLTGLGTAAHLNYLNLCSNHIADVNELSDLDPNYLFLSDNSITDISPLAAQTKLKFLALSQNNISNISDLANLTSLESLVLDHNRASDISVLENLVNLRYLSLVDNQIHDIYPLTKLGHLNSLFMTSNFLDSSAYCFHLPKIMDNNQSNSIYISYDSNPNPITRDCLTTLDELPLLILNWLESPYDPNSHTDLNDDNKTNISDFGIFAGLWYRNMVYIPDPNLRFAVETQIGIINPDPNDMKLLTTLNAPYSEIGNLTGLQYAVQLHELHLNNNNISDLSAVSGLSNLEILDLSANHISDISMLSNLVNLKQLVLQSNQLSDVSILSGLTAMEMLDLSENEISDISPLAGLNHLDYLYLTDNSLNTPAYCTADVSGGYLSLIKINNPGIHLYYDDNPNPMTDDCSTSCADFRIFASHWLENDCDNSAADWCGYADMNSDTHVDLNDLTIFVGLWLKDI